MGMGAERTAWQALQAVRGVEVDDTTVAWAPAPQVWGLAVRTNAQQAGEVQAYACPHHETRCCMGTAELAAAVHTHGAGVFLQEAWAQQERMSGSCSCAAPHSCQKDHTCTDCTAGRLLCSPLHTHRNCWQGTAKWQNQERCTADGSSHTAVAVAQCMQRTSPAAPLHPELRWEPERTHRGTLLAGCALAPA